MSPNARSKSYAVPALVALALILGALLLLRSGSSLLKRTVDLPVVLQQVQKANELVTVKYGVQKVIGLEEQKYPLGSEKLLLIVQARVLAGVDLSQLKAEKIRLRDSDSVYLELPAPRILATNIDEKQTRVWDRRITWWTPWVPYNNDLERQARIAAVKSVEESAIEMGILAEAQRNAEQSLRGLLTALGFRNVQFGPVS
jgi:hypothetical protein